MNHTIIILCLVIAGASLLKGMTSFGFSLMAFPILLNFYSPMVLVPALTLCNVLTSAQIIFTTKSEKSKHSNHWLIIAGFVGIIPGVLLLQTLDVATLKVIVGVIFVLLSILFLSGFRFKIKHPIRAQIIAGSTAGFLGGALSVSGPPLVLFLTSMQFSNQEFRLHFARFSVLTSSVAFIGYFLSGMITPQVWKIFLISFPILILGTILGQRLSTKVSIKFFQVLCITISLCAGIWSLISGLDI
ncbi:sulfite exporter TauE/SafE family protein [Halosquirtibacter xylanolyticus]|uniref:sulfite exporter TauE/SafE family protein n=1 Tax=Halosquirtibacter xylanolyticus TaxID=3374599 RepID=UPI00374A8C43|nr:sulfite exporter TauE/SafE family protein [Prolixibacteraceae bacterium]